MRNEDMLLFEVCKRLDISKGTDEYEFISSFLESILFINFSYSNMFPLTDLEYDYITRSDELSKEVVRKLSNLFDVSFVVYDDKAWLCRESKPDRQNVARALLPILRRKYIPYICLSLCSYLVVQLLCSEGYAGHLLLRLLSWVFVCYVLYKSCKEVNSFKAYYEYENTSNSVYSIKHLL